MTAENPDVNRLRAGASDANLVIIVADAARADHFSAFGYERKTTPQLDKLFAEGTVFTEAYAPAADTKASVASLFTAQFPDTHGVVGRLTGLGPEGSTLAECMGAAGWTTAAFSANPYLCAGFGFKRGFDSFDEVFREVGIMPMGVGPVDGAVLLKSAIAWLRAHRGERFFAYLHFLQPHAPYTPPQAYRQRFTAAAVPSVSEGILNYDANLAYVDDLIGRLLDEMKRLGLFGRSVIVFLSDHGEAFGEHDVYRHERTVYREMVHVPVAFRLPDGCHAPRQVRAEVFSLTDVMPTVLDLFRIEPPGTMQGRSRLGLLARGEETEPAFAVSRARGDDDSGGVERPAQVSYALRGPDYTFVLGALGRQVELYHRSTDPRESHNVAQHKPRMVKQLHRQFGAWAATQRGRPPVLRGGTVFVSPTKRVAIDERTRQRLRQLGYLE